MSINVKNPREKILFWSFVFLTILSFIVLLGSIPSRGESGFSLRFYGHGVNDIDRVKIKIDSPAVPADVGATDFTFEFWIKVNPGENSGTASCNTNGGWITGNIIFDRDIWGEGEYGDYGIILTEGRIGFGINKGSSGTTLCGTAIITDSNWHHVAITRNISTGLMSIFIDGQLDSSLNGPTGDISYRDGQSTSFPNDRYLVIGAEKHDAGSEYPSFSGWLDEVRLSNIILYSSSFTRPSAPFTTDSNTVALYHFDEGPAGPCNSTISDSSNATSGPSNGICNYGGSNPAGPVYTNDTPFNANTPTQTSSPTSTATTPPANTPTQTSSPTSTATTPPSYTNKVYLPLVVWGQAARVQVVQPTTTTTPTTSNPICGLSGMIVFFIVALYLLWIR